jgi:hypothetical protein
VPDPAGAPAAGVVKRLELFDFMVSPPMCFEGLQSCLRL